MVREDVREELCATYGEDTIVFDDHAYDNSIVGVTEDGRVVYDYDKMVEELMEDEDWEIEDAIDWINTNTIGSLPYFDNDKKPIIIYPLQL